MFITIKESFLFYEGKVYGWVHQFVHTFLCLEGVLATKGNIVETILIITDRTKPTRAWGRR